MADVTQVTLVVEELASALVLSDFADPLELQAFLKSLADLRLRCQQLELPDPSRMIVSAVTASGMYKKSLPSKCRDIFSCLLGALREVLLVIGRNESPESQLKAFYDEIKSITTGVPVAVPAVSNVQVKEIPGFVTNTLSVLDEIEKSLLVLEKSPEDQAQLNELFRIFHTIKGEANLLGLPALGGLAHAAEDLLGGLRDKSLSVDEAFTSLLLRVVDSLRHFLKGFDGQTGFKSEGGFDSLVQEMKSWKQKCLTRSLAAPAEPAPKVSSDEFVCQIPVLDLSNGPELLVEFINEGFDHLANSEKSVLILESAPLDTEAINSIFRAFHTIKGAAAFLNLQDIRSFSHEAETMLDLVRKGGLSFEGRVVELTLDAIDFMRQLLELLREQISGGGILKNPYLDAGPRIKVLKEVISGKKVVPPLGEILIQEGAVTPIELKQALDIQKEVSPDKKVGEILVQTHAASIKQVDQALEVQKKGIVIENSIKIQLDKLDSLIDLVGELVISETQVVQSSLIQQIEDQKFHKNLSELDRITRRLQQIAMGMRLVPVGPTFQKMVRLVRDLSKKMDKEIAITLSGEDTEIDKNMVELVGDPLMHMVRNSVDHGIEAKAARVAAGKPAGGKVSLSAFHRGSSVVIEIRDDGGGLRKDKILAKALERGLIKPGEELSDKRIFNLIFEPGFSTAEKVTDVSGRGVGMDVVKKNIEKLRGRIEIESEVGRGSVFSIYLPITLAIIEGIVVRAGDEKYVLPINSVIEFVKAEESLRTLIYGQGEVFSVHGRVYPLIRLEKLFNIPGCRKNFEEATVCFVESEYGRACVLVDELLGQQQVVIKNLGDNLRGVQGVSGAAILGDGRVGLILDMNGLVALAGS